MAHCKPSSKCLKKFKKLYNSGYKFYCEGLEVEDFSDVEAFVRNAEPYYTIYYEVYDEDKEVLTCARCYGGIYD